MIEINHINLVKDQYFCNSLSHEAYAKWVKIDEIKQISTSITVSEIRCNSIFKVLFVFEHDKALENVI